MTTNTHVHRARLYKLASLAFDRPGEELTEALCSGAFHDQLVDSAQALDTPDGDLAARAAAVAETFPRESEAIEELRSTWATNFGFERGGEIELYEIAHGHGTLVTSTDTLADIAGFYGAFDLERADENRDRPDHLVLELEFMSHLALQLAWLERDEDDEGVEIVTDAQQAFLEAHLGRWIPRLRETIESEVEECYPELAAFLDVLVTVETERFDVEPDVFEETPPSPLEGMTDGDGDFRCGTCAGSPSPATPQGVGDQQ